MATVWKARHLTLDREDAIKVMNNSLSGDVELLDRFRKEAQAAAKIRHANVVGVFDAGEANGLPYYIMEYVPGPTVAHLIDEHGPLGAEESLHICLDIAIALSDCWRDYKIIHCDIKPENIIIENKTTVRILDLGLARVMGGMERQAQGGEDDMTVGTPNFMAPEAAMGLKDLDPRSDIYSLGCMLYQMVTGVLPFDGIDQQAVLEGQVNGYIDDPWQLNPDVPPSVAMLIEKMLVKDRDRRHLDWDEVILDFQAVINGDPIHSAVPNESESTVLRAADRPDTAKRKKIVVKKGAAQKNIIVDRAEVREATRAREKWENPNNFMKSLITFSVLAALVLGLYLISLGRLD